MSAGLTDAPRSRHCRLTDGATWDDAPVTNCAALPAALGAVWGRAGPDSHGQRGHPAAAAAAADRTPLSMRTAAPAGSRHDSNGIRRRRSVSERRAMMHLNGLISPPPGGRTG